MKVTCSLSGLQFETSLLPMFTQSKHSKAIIQHPIFSMSQTEVREMTSQLPAFPMNLNDLGTTQEELHLIGTYFLSQLPIEHWSCPLLTTSFDLDYWHTFWLKHIEQLMAVAMRLDGKSYKRVCKFNISTDHGAPAANLKDWLTDTNLVIAELTMPITEEARKLNRQYNAVITDTTYFSEGHCMEIIQRGLQGSLLSAKETKEYPSILAKWARRVGEFPTTRITLANGRKVALADFWEDLLVKGFKLDGTGLIDLLVSDITVGDVEEILEHCSTTILRDNTVLASSFFKELGNLAEALHEFRNPVPSRMKISSSTSSELLALLGADNDEVSGSANFKSLRQTDELAPKRENYSSMKEYLAARKVYAASKEGHSPDSTVLI
jgi:hypothetical protein